MTFYGGNKKLGPATLNGSAQAAITLTNLKSGSHNITAVYGGDSTYNTSTSPVLVQVVN